MFSDVLCQSFLLAAQLSSYHLQIFREKENLPPDKKTLSSIMKEQSHTRVDVIKVTD